MGNKLEMLESIESIPHQYVDSCFAQTPLSRVELIGEVRAVRAEAVMKVDSYMSRVGILAISAMARHPMLCAKEEEKKLMEVLLTCDIEERRKSWRRLTENALSPSQAHDFVEMVNRRENIFDDSEKYYVDSHADAYGL